MEKAVRTTNGSLSDSAADLRWLREQIGVTEAPLVMEGIATVREFFISNLRQDPGNWVSYLRGIDFHKPVRVAALIRGTRLIRYESTGNRTLKPFAYFAKPGESPFRLGTSFPSVEYKEFEVANTLTALESYASGINFGLTDRVSRLGGGLQYIISFADLPVLMRVGERGRR